MDQLNQDIKKFDGLYRRYINVTIDGGYYLNENGEILLRVETKGRTGKVLYRSSFYIMGGKETQVYGMDGSTGHGWGGRIVGYATLAEIENYKEKIR